MSSLWPSSWVSAFWSKKPENARRQNPRQRPDSFFEGKSNCDFSEISTALATDKPNFTFTPHPLIQPTERHVESHSPYNTCRWWQNLTLEEGEGVVPTYPYLLQSKNTGVTICYPVMLPTEDYVISPFVANWDMRFVGLKRNHKVVYTDDLGCSVQWGTSLRGYFVRGSPYVTFDVTKSQLEFVTIHAILSVVVSDNRATITLNNGQTWAIFTTSPVAWSHSMNKLSMPESYTGTLRLAMVPGPVEPNLKVLDQFRSSYPIGGTVGYEFPNSSQCYLHFSFKKKGGNVPLLMLSLPHHQDCMISTSSVELTGYRCIKGSMKAVVGDQWTFLETLSPIQWHSPQPINPSLRESIISSLKDDSKIELDPKVTDPYFVGKGIAKLARLVLIAESASYEDIIPELIERIKHYVEPWLNGTNENKLVYDSSWGGICSINGINDAQADFGNGMYNDHHFHYGYFLYACAVVGKRDPDWIQKFKSPILVLVRDFANPSSQDPFFPKFRVKDFYDGHSWASGLFPFGDGKNQESSSEAINAYYGMYLAGLALNDTSLSNLANLLFTTELRSSRKYWHMDSQHKVYPEVFAKNKTMGILWCSKVDYATWFGKNAEFIHCIQMLPFTPASHLLLDKPWIEEAYPILSQALTRPDPPIAGGWRTFVHMAHAVINPTKALDEFNNFNREMDDGNTLSNTLYWFATQN